MYSHAIVSPYVVYERLKVKEVATVSLGKFGFADQANQEHHDDYQQAHYGALSEKIGLSWKGTSRSL